MTFTYVVEGQTYSTKSSNILPLNFDSNIFHKFVPITIDIKIPISYAFSMPLVNYLWSIFRANITFFVFCVDVRNRQIPFFRMLSHEMQSHIYVFGSVPNCLVLYQKYCSFVVFYHYSRFNSIFISSSNIIVKTIISCVALLTQTYSASALLNVTIACVFENQFVMHPPIPKIAPLTLRLSSLLVA